MSDRMTSERWRQLTELLHAALRHSPSELEAFLDRACADDEGLRYEVKSLLAHAHTANHFLETPAVEAAAGRFATVAGGLVERHIGPYRVLSLLGSGGMGEVYRAHDPKLNRDVALKVLPEIFARDADRFTRFKREAHLLAALNHPNIAAIYGFEDSSGVQALVLELVEGVTLATRIREAPISLNEAMLIAGQVAQALEAAHERGIIHRDLKPANIKVRPDGVIKVLDFGLAKALHSAPSDDLSQSTTMPAPATRPRAIMGTPAYMSPEHVRGETVDKRTDIWAFGCLLYELLTARQAFRGESVPNTIARVFESDPDWDALPRGTPLKIRTLLERCLEKDVRRRLRDIGDALMEIEEAPSQRPSAARHRRDDVQGHGKAMRSMAILPLANAGVLLWLQRFDRRWLLASGMVITAVVVAALIVMEAFRSTSPSDPGQRLANASIGTRPGVGTAANENVPAGAGVPWQKLAGAARLSLIAAHPRAYDPSLSPDGKMIVYAAEDGEQHVDLFFGRPSGGGHVRLTNDSAYESTPRYSADGERIAFTRRGSRDGTPEICTMPALGGPISCSIRPGAGATWAPDGLRFGFLRPAGAGSPPELVTARTDGSDLRVLLRGDSQYPFPRQPAWSPDGTQLAVVRGTGGIAGELWLVSASGGITRKLSDEPPAVFSQAPVFTPDGRGIVYSSNRGGAINIWSRTLDGSAPVQVTTGAGPDESPTVARDGSLAVVNARWRNTLDVYGVSGGAPKILLQHSPYLWAPAFSPDGRDLAFARGEVDGSWHIWTMPAGGGEARRLTSSATGEIYPRYTPDGEFVLYHTWGSPSRIWRVPAAGGMAQPVSSGTHSDGYADVSPDGRWIAFVRAESDGERIYVALLDGRPERLLTPSPGSVPRWSPDGRQIVFSPNRSLNDGIAVIDADGTHERRLTEKGGWPVWWPGDGRIAYLTVAPDQRQEIHVVATGGAMPASLDHVRFVHNNHPFDISRDGQWLATSNTVFVADEIWLLKPTAPMRDSP